jgi:hypothetical protein
MRDFRPEQGRFRNFERINAQHARTGKLVHGNGHMMMIESNSDAVAKLVLSWVQGRRRPAQDRRYAVGSEEEQAPLERRACAVEPVL